MVTKTNFGAYALYTIEAGELAVSITALGATVTSLRYRGRECVPSYDSPEGYLGGSAYLGAAIPCASRSSRRTGTTASPARSPRP